MTALYAPARPGRSTRRSRLAWITRVRPEPVLLAAGVALVPWLYVLARTLPSTTQVSHWNLAWVGLDALESLGLLSTAVLRMRGDDRHRVTAAATGTLLVVDAWFDTVTAASGGELAGALAMALGAELPLAAVCAALALGAPRRGTPPVSPHTPRVSPGTPPTTASPLPPRSTRT
ncbi:hypothetical protein [Streptomyces botrytidirepellens]|uniref:hypothetical protein n=1 Tax=Streptomyces botrytidirepellens TaxID=2486417 RepID=UPI00161EC265|nr:hypothetical protein [Streptomyces botrytidirepellens]